MGIIQLLINEVYEDKKKQEVMTEAINLVNELKEKSMAETENKDNLQNNTGGVERG